MARVSFGGGFPRNSSRAVESCAADSSKLAGQEPCNCSVGSLFRSTKLLAAQRQERLDAGRLSGLCAMRDVNGGAELHTVARLASLSAIPDLARRSHSSLVSRGPFNEESSAGSFPAAGGSQCAEHSITADGHVLLWLRSKTSSSAALPYLLIMMICAHKRRNRWPPRLLARSLTSSKGCGPSKFGVAPPLESLHCSITRRTYAGV